MGILDKLLGRNDEPRPARRRLGRRRCVSSPKVREDTGDPRTIRSWCDGLQHTLNLPAVSDR